MQGDDRFWSLDEFVPKKTVSRSASRDVDAVEITLRTKKRLFRLPEK